MDRVVIVTKETPLEELVRQHLTESAAQFALESKGKSLEPYVHEDAAYKDAILTVRRQVPKDLLVAEVGRAELSNLLFRDRDLIIVCGPDGLFANVAKYVGEQPVLTVNPGLFGAGVLMLHKPQDVGGQIARIQAGEHRVERLPFIKAAFADDHVVWGINDVFIGRADQISARYEIDFGGYREVQSSSGIIVSTGIGSTGWIRSIATMTSALCRGGQHSLANVPAAASSELVFVVREPFPSALTGASIVTGRIMPGRPLVVTSQMPKGGCLFSDGTVEKTMKWSAGSVVTITVGDRYVQRVIR